MRKSKPSTVDGCSTFVKLRGSGGPLSNNFDPKQRYVQVVWSDAYADKPSKAWTVDEITHEDKDNLPVVTRGWLLKEDDKGVSLAPETYYSTEDQKWQYRGRTFILKSMILVWPVEDWPKKAKARKPRNEVADVTFSKNPTVGPQHDDGGD